VTHAVCRLNERAGKNAAMLVEAEEALKAVEVDKAAVDAISDELAEHYRCILSQVPNPLQPLIGNLWNVILNK
jgi:hypothetical protein